MTRSQLTRKIATKRVFIQALERYRDELPGLITKAKTDLKDLERQEIAWHNELRSDHEMGGEAA